MFTEADKAAISGLLARFAETWERKDADQKLANAVAERIAKHNKRIQNIKSAFAVFDFDLVTDDDVWNKLKAAIGAQAFDLAIENGRAAAAINNQEQAPSEEQQPQSKGTQADAQVQTSGTEGRNSEAEALSLGISEAPTVRDGVLKRLQAAGSKGAKAIELRAFFEETYGIKIHEKTVGMTLYRLSRDHLVRREGRTWFIAPPKAEAMNPGAATPGFSAQTQER
jgi:hypothetical protein